MIEPGVPPLIAQLCDLLCNPVFPAQLASAVQGAKNKNLFLKIEASLMTGEQVTSQDGSLYLGTIDLGKGLALPLLPSFKFTPFSTPDLKVTHDRETPTTSETDSGPQPHKRRKTGSTLRLPPSTPTNQIETATVEEPSVRQVHSDTGFPQRMNPKDLKPPVLEPSSTDKLLAGIWRQIYSPLKLSWEEENVEPLFNIRSGASKEVFQTVNALCLKYYNRSQSSRALEMIVQAYWIECHEARTAVIRFEKPALSKTEARVLAIKEACAVLGWKEKDLRNRMAIWRGYKEIKDAGGWPSLIFASLGVYRFCKYRTEFGEILFSRLRQIRSSLEVAADTLHPEWRGLLRVIQQETPQVYYGHPHEWVTTTTAGDLPLPLASTYDHLKLPDGFQYRFMDECVLVTDVFTEDPRRVPDLDPEICSSCSGRQSDIIERNQCTCFPALFGGARTPPPVQIFRTPTGKNNGVIARCPIDRGTALAEFTGLITTSITGLDVMIGGSRNRTYQIYQGTMGNFTRFINHSCRPNAQFQRFYWRGCERIIVVSKGVQAGSEVTVDYSDRYWRELEKRCLCGEACCRFS
ncbi:SET domain protein [Aspergillus carlsbadensis]|nr:SET domain protein [Aspergillus carlsbadensis]